MLPTSILPSLALFCGISQVLADLQVSCRWEDLAGVWVFEEGLRNFTRELHCSPQFERVHTFELHLQYPDVASDQYGNLGFFTLVDDEGFEVVINGRKYFAFFNYKKEGRDEYFSLCDQSYSIPKSHDVLGNNYACFVARKSRPLPARPNFTYQKLRRPVPYDQELHSAEDVADAINKAQNSWTAKANPELLRTASHWLGRRVKRHRFRRVTPFQAFSSKEQLSQIALLPKHFDWRDVNGANYVSPVRDQGRCGSCYVFATLGMLEARYRILTNNTLKVILSPQDEVSCSAYSQGCAGGFPYLVGKYGQDHGLVDESCFPYSSGKNGEEKPCTSESPCKRYYISEYRYVGGYFGACNEALMRLALVRNGPFVVAIEVTGDLLHYSSGVYSPVPELLRRFDPFEATNHAVLVVGYGEDAKRGKYWILKNSWGKDWGEEGYFKLPRGIDEIGVESAAVEAFPIP